MPAVRQRVRRRRRREPPGGIATYGADLLYEEVSYIAFHLHWSQDDLLDLEHADRQRYVSLIQRLAARE
jgi:hypothetical protein